MLVLLDLEKEMKGLRGWKARRSFLKPQLDFYGRITLTGAEESL